MSKTYRIHAEPLTAFVAEIFANIGLPSQQAVDAAEVLVWANLRGVDTHGVRNVMPLYVRRVNNAHINPNATFKIEHETPVSARVDGDQGMGMSAGCWGMRLAIEKARSAGMGFVTMRNSNHFGAAGYYPSMTLPHDMIGIAMTGFFFAQGAEIGVMPTFGSKPMFSTNPISISCPTQDEAPFLLDMATSISPYNRVKLYHELGRIIPLGWGTDSDGNPSTDPSVVRALFPLGGTREMGSHKGFGLAMMVQILCGVLSGGWFDLNHADDAPDTDSGHEVPSFESHTQQSDAHFFAAIRVDAFRPVDEFKQGMDAMIRALHAAPKEPGQDRIYVAGEIEHTTEQERRREGIPMAQNVFDDLQTLATEYGVDFPDYRAEETATTA